MASTDNFTPTPEMIDAVHEWTARRAQERVRRALIPSLRDRFDITNKQAIDVLRAATAKKHGGANAVAS